MNKRIQKKKFINKYGKMIKKEMPELYDRTAFNAARIIYFIHVPSKGNINKALHSDGSEVLKLACYMNIKNKEKFISRFRKKRYEENMKKYLLQGFNEKIAKILARNIYTYNKYGKVNYE